MPQNNALDLQQAIAARLKFYRELGINEFYYREMPESLEPLQLAQSSEANSFPGALPDEAQPSGDNRAKAMRIIQTDIGQDCTRCRLGTQGRKQVVFGTGNLHPNIMFVGEAPGADEDRQGLPFVGRAGQLLNNMIAAMGLRREDVYIANICKCRPPNNRTPEADECATCSPFLMRQIDVLKPKVIVALGAIAAKTLLNTKESMGQLRGRFYDFQGASLAVTYHPAYLLRDPRQKKETWKDLQLVMKYLGMPIPAKSEPGS